MYFFSDIIKNTRNRKISELESVSLKQFSLLEFKKFNVVVSFYTVHTQSSSHELMTRLNAKIFTQQKNKQMDKTPVVPKQMAFHTFGNPVKIKQVFRLGFFFFVFFTKTDLYISIYIAQYCKAYCKKPLCCRPLCASGMDKLELQDCLEHGRVAKVTLPFQHVSKFYTKIYGQTASICKDCHRLP